MVCFISFFKHIFTFPAEPVSLTASACPFCKQPIAWEGERYGTFGSLVNGVEGLYKHMDNLILAQLQIENIGMPSNPTEYGMRHFNFYRCSKCTIIYYGGKKECGGQDDDKLDGALRLCGGCRGCPKHKDEYMVYKCRYCCTPAIWFCFGHTHFCEPCHNQAYALTHGPNHEYMAKEVPVCKGKDTCPLGIDHPHVEEMALWCGACREEETLAAAGLSLPVPVAPASAVRAAAPAAPANNYDDVDWIGGLFGDEPEPEEDVDIDLRDLFADEGEDEEEVINIRGLFEEAADDEVEIRGLFEDLPVNNARVEDEPVMLWSLFDDEPLQEMTLTATATLMNTTQPSGRFHRPMKFLYDNWRGLAVLAAAAVLNSASITVM